MVDSLLGQFILCMVAAALAIAAWKAKSESQMAGLYFCAFAILFVAFFFNLWFVLLVMMIIALTDFARGDEWFGKQRRGLWEEPASFVDAPSRNSR
jgi:uncharacterized membrane protein